MFHSRCNLFELVHVFSTNFAFCLTFFRLAFSLFFLVTYFCIVMCKGQRSKKSVKRLWPWILKTSLSVNSVNDVQEVIEKVKEPTKTSETCYTNRNMQHKPNPLFYRNPGRNLQTRQNILNKWFVLERYFSFLIVDFKCSCTLRPVNRFFSHQDRIFCRQHIVNALEINLWLKSQSLRTLMDFNRLFYVNYGDRLRFLLSSSQSIY